MCMCYHLARPSTSHGLSASTHCHSTSSLTPLNALADARSLLRMHVQQAQQQQALEQIQLQYQQAVTLVQQVMIKNNQIVDITHDT